MSDSTANLKESATIQARVRLRHFLESNTLLDFQRPTAPRLSILLVLYNRAELTLACLRSLQPRLAEVGAEIVLVDNNSRDETGKLLDRLRGAKVIRNPDNRGFPVAVNQAAAAASGKYLLLLNNDTEVLGDSLGTAMRFLDANPDVGAVGGRIILLDGTLQEAGCTFWREGHAFQYGRGDSPTAAEYQFQRDVDYCSAAFLMTRRHLFGEMGGLDVAFSPGYFEDGDYCVRLWRAGWRVVYLPEVSILHYENASAVSGNEPSALYHRNHPYFTQKHADWLAWQQPIGASHLAMRSSHDDRFRILYLPRWESASRGAEGLSGIAEEVRTLRALNCFVTVYPLAAGESMPSGETPDLPPDVEVLPGGSFDTLPDFLAARHEYYDGLLTNDAGMVEQIRQCLQRVEKAA